jgi:adenylylsulfate kinase-like enzyme
MRRAIWITGVPASGKTVLGERLVAVMKRESGTPCAIVDANVIRSQFWPHLGLSPEDRVVNVNGMAELAGVFIRAGNDVVVACIAPDRRVRNQALGLIRVSANEVSVYQVHVMAPLDVLERRDQKGLYQALHAGKLVGLTGVDAPYEPPFSGEALYIDTSTVTVADAAQQVLRYVKETRPHPWPETRRPEHVLPREATAI